MQNKLTTLHCSKCQEEARAISRISVRVEDFGETSIRSIQTLLPNGWKVNPASLKYLCPKCKPNEES